MRWPGWVTRFWLWLMRVEPSTVIAERAYLHPYHPENDRIVGSRDRTLHGKARRKARRAR